MEKEKNEKIKKKEKTEQKMMHHDLYRLAHKLFLTYQPTAKQLNAKAYPSSSSLLSNSTHSIKVSLKSRKCAFLSLIKRKQEKWASFGWSRKHHLQSFLDNFFWLGFPHFLSTIVSLFRKWTWLYVITCVNIMKYQDMSISGLAEFFRLFLNTWELCGLWGKLSVGRWDLIW